MFRKPRKLCDYVNRYYWSNYTMKLIITTWRIFVSETTLLCCIWHIALSLELDQLVITRGAELHNEGSAATSTEQGNLEAVTLSSFAKWPPFQIITAKCATGTGDCVGIIFLNQWVYIYMSSKIFIIIWCCFCY